MDPDPADRVTELLDEARRGDANALAKLFPIVYAELRRIASRELERECSGHTLQPTALVHEAYLKLLKQRSSGFSDRAQFLGITALAMRRILVDHARGKGRKKRSAGELAPPNVSLDHAVALFEERALDVVALDAALDELEAADPRKARLVLLRFYGGLEMKDAAEILGVPVRTAERDWTVARAFLRSRVGDESSS